jgi:hypothetical protein
MGVVMGVVYYASYTPERYCSYSSGAIRFRICGKRAGGLNRKQGYFGLLC